MTRSVRVMKTINDGQHSFDIVRSHWPFAPTSRSHAAAALLCLLNRHAQDNAQPVSAALTWNASLNAIGADEARALKLAIPLQLEDKPTLADYLSRVPAPELTDNGKDLVLLPFAHTAHKSGELDHESGPSQPPLPCFSLETQQQGSSTSTLLTAVYSSEHYDHRLIRHLCSQYQHLAAQFSAMPATCLAANLSFCSSFDRGRILEWNSCPPPCVEDVVTARFDLQVRRQPSAPAISAFDGDFSYGAVQELSTRMAYRILELAPGSGKIIPLCFDKSAAAIITMLAVLRAGCACANISPVQPIDRQRRIYNTCGSNIIICSPHLARRMREVAAEDCIVLEVDAVAIAALPTRSVLPARQLPFIEPSSLAYILFTSGTTGQPKAIAVEHGSLCTSAEAHGIKWRIGPGARVLQFAAYSFDVSVADIFFSLTRGACICSPSETERLDDLAGAARRMRANWAYLTCSMAAAIPAVSMPAIDFLLVGGEAPTQRMIQDWAPHTDLVVSTGPAESSIHCMGSEPVASDADPRNVGRAIGGRLWVTEPDDPTKLAPFGAVGELVIEGRIVSRGYLKDAQRTAASFFTEPPYLPASEKGVGAATRRLYRSGDLVQYAMDGTLRMMGRRDDQVKVRGQRVELAEVETHLRQAAPWANSIRVLLAKKEHFDGLIAFFAVDMDNDAYQATQPAAWEQAQAFMDSRPQLLSAVVDDIKRKVPSYMVPQAFIPVSKLPTTLNGKLDTATLYALHEAITQAQARVNLEAAASPMCPDETLMARMWNNVLGVGEELIGRESDFFRLGGDSLAAIRLVAHASSMGVTFGFALLSQYPKLKDLTRAVVAETSSSSGVSVSPPPQPLPSPGSLLPNGPNDLAHLQVGYAEQCKVEEELIEDVYPCTPMQEAFMSLSLRYPGTYTTRTVWRCASDLDKEKFRRAWCDVYAANDILRTRIVIDDDTGSLMQVVVGESLRWECNLDTQPSSSLEFELGEPLMRCAFASDGSSERDSRFVLEMHHAIYDAFSMASLLNQVYRAYSNQEAQPAVPFKAFVAYGQALDKPAAETFWKAQLDGFGFACSAGHPGAAASSFGSPRPFQCSRSLSRSDLPNKMKHTLATVITAAFASVLRSHLCSDDVCFGTTTSGRHAPLPSISEVMGPTLTTFPLRVKHVSGQSPGDLLLQVRKQLSDAIPYEQYGLQNIKALGEAQEMACSFDTILIVQIPPRESPFQQLVGSEERSSEAVQEFGLLVECTPSETDLHIRADFHQSQIIPEKVEDLLERLCTTIARFSVD